MSDHLTTEGLEIGSAAVAFATLLTTLTLDRNNSQVAAAALLLATALPLATAAYVSDVLSSRVTPAALAKVFSILARSLFLIGVLSTLAAIGHLFAYFSPSALRVYRFLCSALVVIFLSLELGERVYKWRKSGSATRGR